MSKVLLDQRGQERCSYYAALLIEPLRKVARMHGYALGVHGSLKRDIDLIAVPWVEAATTAEELAEALRAEAEKIIGFAFVIERDKKDGLPRHKPHGRLCWAFHLGGGPYIDLAVFPRLIDFTEEICESHS